MVLVDVYSPAGRYYCSNVIPEIWEQTRLESFHLIPFPTLDKKKVTGRYLKKMSKSRAGLHNSIFITSSLNLESKMRRLSLLNGDFVFSFFTFPVYFSGMAQSWWLRALVQTKFLPLYRYITSFLIFIYTTWEYSDRMELEKFAFILSIALYLYFQILTF